MLSIELDFELFRRVCVCALPTLVLRSTLVSSKNMLAQEFLPRSQPRRSPSFSGSSLQAIGSLWPTRSAPLSDTQTENRISEAVKARDVVVQRLESACSSIRQKTTLIEQLEKENLESQEKLRSFQLNSPGGQEDSRKMEELVRGLQDEIKSLKLGRGQPPNYEEVRLSYHLRCAHSLITTT